MQIAVIDDGVSCFVYKNITKLAFDLVVTKDGQIVRRKRKYRSNTHGTVCASIIKHYAPEAEIGSIQVLSSRTENGSVERLLTALLWCEKNNIPIIHMSLGSIYFDDMIFLYPVIKRLLSKQIVLVAAQINTNSFSVPACINGVYGVRTDKKLKDDAFVSVKDCGLFDVPLCASGSHQLIKANGSMHITLPYNSYAAPLVTAKIFNFICQRQSTSLKDITNYLGIDESIDINNRIKNTNFLNICSTKPIIQIKNFDESALRVAENIAKEFCRNNYPAAIFMRQESELSELLIFKIPPGIDAHQYISYVSDQVGLSIALFVGEEKIDADLFVCSGNQKRNKYKEDTIYLRHTYNEISIRNAVKKILHCEQGEGGTPK